MTKRDSSNQAMAICYFRTIEDLHNFSHGPLHRKA